LLIDVFQLFFSSFVGIWVITVGILNDCFIPEGNQIINHTVLQLNLLALFIQGEYKSSERFQIFNQNCIEGEIKNVCNMQK
jgi:hypothetical protein